MKSNLIIITEDILKIQTYSGKLGGFYSLVYTHLLALKIKLIIKLLRGKYNLTLLSSDNFINKSVKQLHYSQELDRDRLSKLKPKAWKLTNHITETITEADKSFTYFQSIPLTKLWENKLAINLIYNYLAYFELVKRLLGSHKYDTVLILGNSLQDQPAKHFAKRHQLKLINLSWPNFNLINSYLTKYFRTRELKHKTKHFINQSLKVKPKLNLSKSTVLLSVDFFRHLKTLVPIYNQLKSTSLNPWLITDDPIITDRLDGFKLRNPNYLFQASFLPPSYYQQNITNWQPSIKSLLPKVKKRLLTRQSALDRLFLKQLFIELEPTIKHGLILSRLYLTAGHQLISQLKPKAIVVVANTRLVELSLVHLAKLHNIPSLTVSNRTMMFKEEPYQYNLTDKIVVPGLNSKKYLREIKISENKIYALGDPRYDYFKKFNQRYSASKVKKQLSINKTSTKVILLISFRPNSQLSYEEKRDFFLFAFKAVKNLKNTIIVVKPHPTEKQSSLKKELLNWGITQAIVTNNQKTELFDLLKISSAVVMVWSMTGLEAMMLKKPVIILNPHSKNYDQFIPYIKTSAATEAKSASQLEKSLKRLTNSHHPKTINQLVKAKQFTNQYIRPFDGLASQRIANLILKITKN